MSMVGAVVHEQHADGAAILTRAQQIAVPQAGRSTTARAQAAGGEREHRAKR